MANAQDGGIEFCRNDEERKILRDYRNADEAGKARMQKTMILAMQGRLPSAVEIEAMGVKKTRALIDSMEVTP